MSRLSMQTRDVCHRSIGRAVGQPLRHSNFINTFNTLEAKHQIASMREILGAAPKADTSFAAPLEESFMLTSIGPTPQLPQLINNIQDWDAVLALRSAMTRPGLSLQQKLQLAASPGLSMPQGTAVPGNAAPGQQEDALARFNAIVDALVSLSSRSGFDLSKPPSSMQVVELFYLGSPQPGFIVKLAVGNKLEQVPVYRRV